MIYIHGPLLDCAVFSACDNKPDIVHSLHQIQMLTNGHSLTNTTTFATQGHLSKLHTHTYICIIYKWAISKQSYKQCTDSNISDIHTSHFSPPAMFKVYSHTRIQNVDQHSARRIRVDGYNMRAVDAQQEDL